MPKPVNAAAKSNVQWLSTVFKSCLLIFTLIFFSACSTTNTSSRSASLVSAKVAAPASPKVTVVKSAVVSAPAPTKVAGEQVVVVEPLLASTTPSNALIANAPSTSKPETVTQALVEEIATPVAAAQTEVATIENVTTSSLNTPEIVAGLDGSSPEMLQSAMGTVQMAEAHLDLINQNLFTQGLRGNLSTGQAGEDFLRDNGINNSYVLTAEFTDPRPSLAIAALEEEPNPAPSAGAASEIPVTYTTFNTDKLSKSATSKTGLTESLLMAAYGQTGRHYKNGGQNPGIGFDAPGFTKWVYSQRGINLPKDAQRQANGGQQVTRDELRPGDLLIYRDPTNESNSGYHVGIYTGQGNFLHAASKTGVVSETAAFGPQFAPYFVGGRRYYDDPQAAPLSDVQKMSATSSAVKLALSELGPNDIANRSIAKKKPIKTAAKTKKTATTKRK